MAPDRADRGPNVRALLEQLRRAGWTDARLAKHLGVNVKTVWTWRTDQKRPRPQHLAALVALVGTEGTPTTTSGSGSRPSAPVPSGRDPTPDFLRRVADLVEGNDSMPPTEAARWFERLRQFLRP